MIFLTASEAAVSIIHTSEKNNMRFAADLKSIFLIPDGISDSLHTAHHENLLF